MAFKFSNLSLPAGGGAAQLDPDTAIIDDLIDEHLEDPEKDGANAFSGWPRAGEALDAGTPEGSGTADVDMRADADSGWQPDPFSTPADAPSAAHVPVESGDTAEARAALEVESLSELLSDTEFGKQLSDSAAPRSNEPSRHNSDDDGLDSSLDDFYDGAAASSFFDGVAGSAASTAAAAALASQRASRRFRTPLLGRLPLKQQVNLLLGIITIGLTLALGSAAYDSRASNMLAAQNEVVGDALMHSQRLAKAAGIAVQGSTLAYDQLQDSVKKLTAAAQLLTKGGDHAGQRVAPVGLALQPAAGDFAKVWSDMSPSVRDVIDQEKVLVRFNQLAYQGRIAAADLIDTDARAIDAVRRAGANPQDLVLLTQMDLHLRTIVGEMSRLMQTNDVRAEDAATLAKNIEGYALLRSAAFDGNVAMGLGPLRNMDARTIIQQATSRADAFVRSALEAQRALPGARPGTGGRPQGVFRQRETDRFDHHHPRRHDAGPRGRSPQPMAGDRLRRIDSSQPDAAGQGVLRRFLEQGPGGAGRSAQKRSAWSRRPSASTTRTRRRSCG